MATSAGARARIRMAAQRGEEIPPGLALDVDGNPTTDPCRAIEGVLLPAPGHKGYGLALAVEALAGVLSGALFGREVGGLYEHKDRPEGVGYFFACLPVDAAIPDFPARVQRMIEEIRSLASAVGFQEVQIPGDRARRVRKHRLANGIPIPLDVLEQLNSLARELDVYQL